MGTYKIVASTHGEDKAVLYKRFLFFFWKEKERIVTSNVNVFMKTILSWIEKYKVPQERFICIHPLYIHIKQLKK